MQWILSILFSLFIAPVFAQDQKAVVSVNDFTPALGSLKGTLTYLDYSSGKPFTMPANVTISVYTGKPNGIILALDYPKEPQANGNDTLVISKEGVLLNGGKIVSKKQLADGSLEIIADKEGRDGNDNKKALLRHIYNISKTKFSNRKEVKFEGTDAWILGNEYTFSR
jgi:hypothetical protein